MERQAPSFRPGSDTERGRFTGHGPDPKQVPDAEIETELSARLRHLEGRIRSSEIEVDVDRGEVTLRGTVANRSQKAAVEALAETVTGVRDIHNQLRVQSRVPSTPATLERETNMAEPRKIEEPTKQKPQSVPEGIKDPMTDRKRPYLDVSNAAQDVPENVGYGAENEVQLRGEKQASRVGAGIGTDAGGEGGTSGNWGGDATQNSPKEESWKGRTSPSENVPKEKSNAPRH